MYSDHAYLIRILKTRPGYRAEIVLILRHKQATMEVKEGSKTEVFNWAREQHQRLADLPPDQALPIRYEAPWGRRRPDQPIIRYDAHPEW